MFVDGCDRLEILREVLAAFLCRRGKREHAALRRVATLVARETSPAEVFAAVTR